MVSWFLLTFGLPTVSAVVSLLILRRMLRRTTHYCDCSSFRARRAVITGATSGIGLATAHELAHRGWSLILACRNLEVGSAVKKSLIELYKPPSIEVFHLDLADLPSIIRFSEKLSSNDTVDVLINNAGIMAGSRDVIPNLKMDSNMLVNFVGQFCLFQELLPFLKNHHDTSSSLPRVIFVSSALGASGTLHSHSSDSLLQHLPPETWSAQTSYANSKQALNLCAQEIARRFGSGKNRFLNVYTVVTGGMVNTNLNRDIIRDLPSPAKWLLRGLSGFVLKTPKEGCQSIIHCAISEDVYGAHLPESQPDPNQGSGRLYRDCRPIEWPESSSSPHLADAVYSKAAEIYRRIEK
ncbi:hypothetical protein Aperf_G00000045078 [Anoplocephala perfoliata]